MKSILFCIGHPAHVHLFKNTIRILNARGYNVIVVSVDKEVSLSLLRGYSIQYTSLGKTGRNLISKAFNYPLFTFKILKIILKKRPKISMSAGSPYLALASWIIGIPHYAFIDTEHAKLAIRMFLPFTKKVFTPSCFKSDLGKKQIRYDGYHELAYLHPNYFKPNPNVLKELGVKKGEPYFILRFVSWAASHDVGHKGLTIESKRELIKLLNKHGQVFISSEKTLLGEFEKYRFSLPPEKMHDVLFYSNMYIGEGATMASETALLGIPSIYLSSLVGTMGNFIELEKRYGICYSYSNFNKALKKIKDLLEIPDLKEVWLEKMEKLLKDKIDVTKLMVGFVEK